MASSTKEFRNPQYFAVLGLALAPDGLAALRRRLARHRRRRRCRRCCLYFLRVWRLLLHTRLLLLLDSGGRCRRRSLRRRSQCSTTETRTTTPEKRKRWGGEEATTRSVKFDESEMRVNDGIVEADLARISIIPCGSGHACGFISFDSLPLRQVVSRQPNCSRRTGTNSSDLV